MNILTVLYSLIISPLELLFETVFAAAYKISGNPGLSIVFLSLAFNILVLPLYKRADELQAEERDIQARMAYRIKRTKQTFKGDERFLMLQEYYRINNYKPIYALKSSVSLLLQIPFFIAAYHMLSGMKCLQGTPFGFISDLGAEDAMFMIGNFPVNVLPILMTLINIVSGIIYTRGQPLKAKIQVYGLAVVFLVLLYRSPSGLVMYWLLNNVFSLVKNAVTKLFGNKTAKKTEHRNMELGKSGFSIVMLSCVLMAVLTGIMIPSDVVVKNPAEMINTFSADPHPPVNYIVISAAVAAGMFVLWIPVFTYFIKAKAKPLEYILPAVSMAGVVNYFFFNKNFGWISNKLIYDYNMVYEVKEIIINILVDVLVAAAVVAVVMKFRKLVKPMSAIALFAVVFLAAIRVVTIIIFSSQYNYYYSNTAEDVKIPLTSSGKNVVVLMIDKTNGSYIPYLFNERPDIAEKFDGFTYYPNTVSFGKYTNFGTPALFGGYDYTPDKINARSEEPLVKKQNEALLTLPRIFSDNGWKATVVDPSYANYQWRPDLSIYDEYEKITAYNMTGVFNDREEFLANAGEDLETRLTRNMFCYGVMKTMPYLIQPAFYANGEYLNLNLVNNSYAGNSLHTQEGLYEWHIQAHSALEALSDVTEVTPDPENCYFVMSNSSAHDICLLKEPEYVPAVSIDNTEYDAAHEDRFTVDGVTMHMDTDYLTYAAYECTMEAFISLGNWFDYLRENGLYDNTRIIIVSDHGSGFGQFDELLVEDIGFDAQAVNPVLMVKDFDSTGFSVSDEFMTNADTPSIALQGLVDDPVNPFTNNPIYQDCKAHELLIYISENNNTSVNNGNRFEDPDGYWLTVRGNIYDDENWSLYPGEPN